jgi:hypothetical protein
VSGSPNIFISQKDSAVRNVWEKFPPTKSFVVAVLQSIFPIYLQNVANMKPSSDSKRNIDNTKTRHISVLKNWFHRQGNPLLMLSVCQSDVLQRGYFASGNILKIAFF